jgi:hypothetical protein
VIEGKGEVVAMINEASQFGSGILWLYTLLEKLIVVQLVSTPYFAEPEYSLPPSEEH